MIVIQKMVCLLFFIIVHKFLESFEETESSQFEDGFDGKLIPMSVSEMFN